MQTELGTISIFVTVVEAGSFSNAAEQLHLTRSAISKSIARLEERLKVTLFKRTTRTLSLTAEGALFYEHSQRALTEINTAETLLDQGRINATGLLRISAPVLFGQLYVTPLMMEFAQQHPDLQIELSFNDRTVDLIEDGFDLAIRIGTLPDSNHLVARKLGDHRMLLCATPAYIQRSGAVNSLDDLQQHTTIAYPYSGHLQKWHLQDEKKQVYSINPKAKLLLNDMQAIKNMVLLHHGIAWLPDWLIHKELHEGSLLQVLANFSSVDFPIHVVWPALPYMPLKTRLAIDQFVVQLPQQLKT
ncbi:LysR family transcriptional regulator [Acinetobacter sp. ANC 3926]|uniref:LysR family transcriptional regulator n=1 Tax=Acinetobacter genomosp. 15BJ TaxID=106651 RepID=UPI001F4A6673|nr:LysR family transcriptional regulator [Acinetobacter genomosp. 15BJ]MCH7293280.1 LysR family transcriptional regulator [Acinetobacter genomosp. 15BJ]